MRGSWGGLGGGEEEEEEEGGEQRAEHGTEGEEEGALWEGGVEVRVEHQLGDSDE